MHLPVPRLILIMACALAPAFVNAADGGLDARIQKFMQETKIPGLAVVVVRAGKPDYAKGFGVRSIESNLPVDEHTVFKMNSVSKSMTATAIAAFVDQGKMKWEDRIIDYYPEFRLSDPWITREVRFEDAMSHRVGVEATDWLEDLPNLKLSDAIQRMRFFPQQNGFRANYMYDNFMYSVAGVAAGRLAGDWDQMIQVNLFRPLGMTDSITSFELYVNADSIAPCHECELDTPPAGLRALSKQINIAAPHIYANGKAQLTHWRISNSRPAGAIWSSAHDMTAYLKLYLNAGKLEGKQILSEKVLRQLTTPRIPSSTSGIGARKEGSEYELRKARKSTAYALGWGVGQYMDHPLIQHGGASIEFQSNVLMLPADGIGIAVMANMREGRGGVADSLAMDIADELLGLTPVDWTGALLKTLSAEEREAATPASKKITAPPLTSIPTYLGRYHHPAYGDITVERRDAQSLLLSQGKNRWGVLRPVGHDCFELNWNGVRPGPEDVAFTANKDGRASELKMRGQAFVRADIS